MNHSTTNPSIDVKDIDHLEIVAGIVEGAISSPRLISTQTNLKLPLLLNSGRKL